MENYTIILLLLALIESIHCFQLQGTWTITDIKDFPINYQPVTMEVDDTVYHNTSIMQSIVFTGCQSYQYMMEFDQNNLFISYSSLSFVNQQISQQTNNSSLTLKCTNDTAKMHAVIRANLVQVFYFQLIGNYLVFLNPKKEIVFKFQRVESLRVRNLRGIWNMTNLNGPIVSQKVQIADTQITLCSGKIIVGYILSDKYGFKTRLVQNDSGCDIKDLDKTILSSAFSRRIGNSLEIYDTNLNLIVLMSFVSDIDLAAAQAQRQKAIQDAINSQQQKAFLQQHQQQQSKVNETSLVKIQYQQQSLQTTLTLLNNKDDLLGIWQPVSVMGIPTDSTEIYFIISSNTISFNGGCNSYQFQYSVVDDSSKQIKIGQNKSSSNQCSVDDDGLYVNGMIRVSKYMVVVVGSDIRLRLSDSNGNIVYEIKKTVQQQSTTNSTINNTTNSNSQQKTQSVTLIPSTTTTSSPQSLSGSFQNGKYVFLVLARRDLPRKFCTITGNKITYSGCNNIQHTIKVVGNNQLQITGGAVTNNTCSINNDSVIINAFNSIVTFSNGLQAGSYVLKTTNNVDIINFSQF